jgi:hypothetical protein
MNPDERIEAALRRRPSDERTYDEPLAALAFVCETKVRLRPVTRARLRAGAVPALASLCLVAIVGAGLLVVGWPRGSGQVGSAPADGSASASETASRSPTAVTTIDLSGPIPQGMLPLGPARAAQGAPDQPVVCTAGSYVSAEQGIPDPDLYDALPADVLTDSSSSGSSARTEIVDYDWAGHRPAGADGQRVTIPDLRWAMRSSFVRMRIAVATSRLCFSSWRVTARAVRGYDGSPDTGGWTLLGDGEAATDAAVVAGLPEGDWMIHVHLTYRGSAAETYSTDSYARVVVAGQVAIPAANVPAPDPAAQCSGQTLEDVRPLPDMAMTVAAGLGSSEAVLGTLSRGTSAGQPDRLPTEVVSMEAGSLFTIRTVDGSCGNDWAGVYFFAVPDSVDGPIAPLSGLPSNNGSDPDSPTLPIVGAINGIAPAPGEWLIGVMFNFGNPAVGEYFWHVSVR